MGRLTIIAVLGLVFIIGSFVIPIIKDDVKEQQNYCEERNITGMCNYAVARCYNDCESLGKEYFKWQDGGFASAECWCKVNNETIQIW